MNVIFLLLVLAVSVLLLPRLATELYALPRTYDPANVPTRRAAIVFGAGLRRDGSPTGVLRDRVQQAANLYFAGKVEKLLMSGDNRFVEYNEPEAMRQFALELGVPDEDIVRDFAGRSTYETCYRATAIFGLNQAILVTQKFHLPRAIFLCNMLGLDGIGVEANLLPYGGRTLFWWNARELLATLNAYVDVVRRPLPVLGTPEPIFPDSAQ